MGRIDVSKLVFVMLCVAGGLGLAFGVGLHSGAKRNAAYHAVRGIADNVAGSLQLLRQEAPTLAGLHPTHFLQPARRDGAGVTVDEAPDRDALILLSGFFEDGNQLRLLRRDGTMVAKWPVRFSALFPNPGHMWRAPATDWNIDTHGALALPDGSVVFNFEEGGLVKLDRCGGVVWTLARRTHHSVERAEGGGFWVPDRRSYAADEASPFPPFTTPLNEDWVLRVSEDGQVESAFSVPRLLYDAGLEALLTASGHPFHPRLDIVHLNKVGELPAAIAAAFPAFAAGDLVLSLRGLNLVLVADPAGRRVKWWQTGPWIRQHDPEFLADGSLLVFNNNNYLPPLPPDAQPADARPPEAPPPRASNIIAVNPTTGAQRVVYGGDVGQDLLSVIRAKVDPTPGGGLFVTEFEGGRVFETDADGRVVWDYVNRYDSDEVAEITEGRLYPAGYFTVRDWSCKQAAG